MYGETHPTIRPEDPQNLRAKLRHLSIELGTISAYTDEIESALLGERPVPLSAKTEEMNGPPLERQIDDVVRISESIRAHLDDIRARI